MYFAMLQIYYYTELLKYTLSCSKRIIIQILFATVHTYNYTEFFKYTLPRSIHIIIQSCLNTLRCTNTLCHAPNILLYRVVQMHFAMLQTYYYTELFKYTLPRSIYIIIQSYSNTLCHDPCILLYRVIQIYCVVQIYFATLQIYFTELFKYTLPCSKHII